MTEAEIVSALLDPKAPLPAGLRRSDGQASLKRFSVYRNTVVVGLTENLKAGFPVVCKLVGSAFFEAMAAAFVRRHPPRSRIMMLYGDEFAGFMGGFPAIADLAYLPDVARLEQTLRESYHAANVSPVSPETLRSLSEATLLGSRIAFAPSVKLVRSLYPIHAIWRANVADGPVPVPRSEDVVVLRREFDPRPHLLPQGGGAFLASLLSGATLAEAMRDISSIDLAAVLTLLIDGNAIVEISI